MIERPAKGSAKLRRVVAYFLYYGFARHLPYSAGRGRRWARAVRFQVCRHMFAHCGVNVNVERGARFGSGRLVRIGDNSGLGRDCYVAGQLTVGRDVMIGPSCVFLTTNHRMASLSTPMNTQGATESPITVEDDVWIGFGATILPGRTVGRGAVVAACSVVTKDVTPFAVVGGNPARQISTRMES